MIYIAIVLSLLAVAAASLFLIWMIATVSTRR